ncbi:MAG: BrnT family toxin [Candidatus Aminicenantaceae bacterium]
MTRGICACHRKMGLVPIYFPDLEEKSYVGIRDLSTLLYLMLDNMYRCTYNIIMLFEWDSKKAISNLKKHGVDFADAVTVLEDERAITILDDYPDEERFVTIGMDSFGRILVVVYAWHDSRIRIISARKATAKEIKEYKG